jgi:hypothetical protein
MTITHSRPSLAHMHTHTASRSSSEVYMRNLRPLRLPLAFLSHSLSLTVSHSLFLSHTPISVALRLVRFLIWPLLIVIACLLWMLPRRGVPIRTAVLNLFQP